MNLEPPIHRIIAVLIPFAAISSDHRSVVLVDQHHGVGRLSSDDRSERGAVIGAQTPSPFIGQLDDTFFGVLGLNSTANLAAKR